MASGVWQLRISSTPPVRAANGGLFVSRGQGTHPTRIIDSHELILVRSGTLAIREERRYFRVGESETLLLRPGREHSGTELYSGNLSFYWAHFYLPARSASRDGFSLPQHGRPRRPERLMELMHGFFEEQRSPRLGRVPLDLLMMLMLCEAADSLPPGSRGAAGASSLWARAEEYIAAHSHQHLSTSQVAAALECNGDHLGHVFRDACGKTLTQAIHQARLDDARRLLLEGQMSIKQVARACGFATPGYFRRLFHRQEGITPRQYRQLHQRVQINWR